MRIIICCNNKQGHKQQQQMLASSLTLVRSKLPQLLARLNLLKPRPRPVISSLTLLAGSMYLLPKCIKLAQQQNTQNKNNHQPSTPPPPIIHPTQDTATVHSQERGIINFIKEYDDAKLLDLKGVTLLWYQCCGDTAIDDEVVNMLRKFVQTNYHNISCPFKIIIDRTPRSVQVSQSSYYKKQLQLVIIKPQTLKPIRLSKHLSYCNPSNSNSLSYSSLFTRLTNQLNQFQQLNFTNIHTFLENVGNRPYEGLVLMNAPRQSIKINKAKKKFNHFIQDKSTFGNYVEKGIVTDQMTAKYLGLPNFRAGEDNVYILVVDSQNVQKPGREVLINGQKYHIYAPWQLKDSLTFSPYLQRSSPSSLTLKLSVDLNQNIYSQLSNLYQTLGPSAEHPTLSQIPKILHFNSTAISKQKPIQIILQKNNFQQIVNTYALGTRYSQNQKKELLYQGSKWKYHGDLQDIDARDLENWITSVMEGRVQPHFDTEKKQDTKVKKYNSTRITGEQYQKILQKNPSTPKLIFHYSEHCFSCNKFKHIYEQIAQQKKQQIDFYRIDNDFNRSKGLINFASTPIFVLFRNNPETNKLEHFVYKNNIFTKSLFESFLEITSGVKIVGTQVLDKALQDRNKTGDIKMQEFL